MTVDALTFSAIDEAWNGFIPDILNKDSMVGTITARDQIYWHRKNYLDVKIILQEASETVYIIFMGMNTSSRSTPTSLMYIISFTSRFDQTVVLEF